MRSVTIRRLDAAYKAAEVLEIIGYLIPPDRRLTVQRLLFDAYYARGVKAAKRSQEEMHHLATLREDVAILTAEVREYRDRSRA